MITDNRDVSTRTRLLVVWGALLLVLAMTPGFARPAPASASASTVFGFNNYVDANNVAHQKRLLGTPGAPVRRMFVYWSDAEPVPGVWDWSSADQDYKSVVDAGLTPQIVAMGAPCWARPSVPCLDSFTVMPDAAFYSSWQNFLKRLVARYPKAMGIEIWNEPNLRFFSSDGIDPVKYTDVLKQGYAAVKAVKPGLPVISAGLAGIPGEGKDDGGWSFPPFLRAMFQAGAASAMDAIGIHVYPTVETSPGVWEWSADGFEPVLDAVRTERTRAGVNKNIWVTEAGESTTTSSGRPPAASPEQQAADLVAIIDHVRSDPDVPVLILHAVDDAPFTFFFGVDAGFGVFSYTGVPKPAACAVSRKLGGGLRC